MPLNTYSHLYLYNMIFLHIFLEIICISINIYTNWQRCKRKLYLHQCTHTSMHTCIHTMHTYKRTHLFHIQADMYIYIYKYACWLKKIRRYTYASVHVRTFAVHGAWVLPSRRYPASARPNSVYCQTEIPLRRWCTVDRMGIDIPRV